jgi:phosphatidylinositol glycan class N
MYLRKHELKSRAMFYRAFIPLAGNFVDISKAAIEEALAAGRFSEAMTLSRKLAQLSLDGLSYLQKYDWPFLMLVVVVGYATWMIYVVLFVTVQKDPTIRPARGNTPEVILAVVVTVLSAYLMSQGSPPMYYVYTAFPCYFAWCAMSGREQLERAFLLRAPSGAVDWYSTMLNLVGGVFACLSAAALILSYFWRETISFGFFVAAMAPLAFGKGPRSAIFLLWAVLCSCCGVFPFLSANLVDSPFLITVGGVAILLVGALPFGYRVSFCPTTLWRLFLLAASVLVDVAESFRVSGSGVDIVPAWFVRGSSWAILALSLSPWPSVPCVTDQ